MLTSMAMKTALLALLLSAISLAADNTQGIQKVLTDQTAAWNRGDLETFVATYDADCVFVGDPLIHGRDQTLARYRRKYPDKARMGQLTFTILEIKSVDNHAATVIGKFHLHRAPSAGGMANGIFSLVLRERNGQWLILLDHTS